MGVTRQRGLLPRIIERIVNLNRPLTVVGLILVCIAWLAVTLTSFSYPDFWWQLREGLDYLNTGVAPESIAASYAPQIILPLGRIGLAQAMA